MPEPNPQIISCVKCHAEIDIDSVFCKYCGKKQKSEPRKSLKRPNGSGTVYKNGGRRTKPWVAAVTSAKKGEAKTTAILGYFKTKTEALNSLNDIPSSATLASYDMTLRDAYDAWYPSHYANITASAKNVYKAAWAYFEPFTSVKLREFNAAHIQSAIDDAVSQSKSRSTCEKIRQIASQLCKFGMKNDLLNKNYAQLTVLPKAESKQQDILTSEEIKKIDACAGDKTADIIIALIYTGVRINELFTILHDDVHLEESYMIGGEKTDAGINRVIPIHSHIRPIIQKWYNENNKYLVSNSTGGKMDVKNFRERKFYPFLEGLKIISPKKEESNPKHRRITPHSMRRTFISGMVKKGVAPELLQKIVGHEQYETTVDIYTKFTDEDVSMLVSEVEKFNANKNE